MLLQRGVVLPRKSVKKPRSTPVARGVITNVYEDEVNPEYHGDYEK